MYVVLIGVDLELCCFVSNDLFCNAAPVSICLCIGAFALGYYDADLGGGGKRAVEVRLCGPLESSSVILWMLISAHYSLRVCTVSIT